MATRTEKPSLPWFGEGKHEADPRRYDPIAKASWCICGKFLWPHDLVKHRLSAGYRHLECGKIGPDGVPCTYEVSSHPEGKHGARVGNAVAGWRLVTWPGKVWSSSRPSFSDHS